jgi:hypothetical protein
VKWYLANGEGGFDWGMLGGFLLILVIIVVLGRAKTRWNQKRERELPRVAERLGLEFQSEPDAELAFQWCLIDHELSRGGDRYAENIMRGAINGFPVVGFDHHHETSSNKGEVRHVYNSVLIVILPKGIKAVEVLPESLATKLSQSFGLEDIDFESAEFSKAFCVRAQNKRAAYDVCNPQVMEYLLAHPLVRFRIKTDALFLIANLLSAAEIETNLRHLVEIRSRLPEYLFTQV